MSQALPVLLVWMCFRFMIIYLRIIYTVLVFLYLFAYGIKIYSVPISVFLSLLSVTYLCFYRLVPKFLKIWLREIVLVLIIVFYLLLLEASQGVGLSLGNFSFYIIRILIEGILPAYVLSHMAKKIKIDFSDFVYVLVVILLIEFIFLLIMVFIPDFKNFIFVYIYNYSDQSVLMNELLFYHRGFGIAYTYLAWFPFTLALIFLFCLFSNIVKSKFILFLLCVAVLSLIVLNARIGFIPLFIGILIYVCFSGTQGIKNIFYFVLISAFVCSMLSYLDFSPQLNDRIDFLKEWVIDDGVYSFFSEEGSATIKDLSNFQIFSNISIPDLMFGRGDILDPETNPDLYTDVGYIQILYTGGLILSLLLYTLFILFARRLIYVIRTLCAKKTIPQLFIYFPYIMCTSFLIGHGKLRIFEMNEATRFLFLLISFFIFLPEINCGLFKSDHLNLKK